MTRLTEEELRQTTLARQFPAVTGRGPEDVLELVRRLGPIQSQVPRSPFLTVSSRLPGVPYAAVRDLFASHRLLKTSSLRGTVHTTGRDQYPLVDAVARRQRAGSLRSVLKLQRVTAEELMAETESCAADDWRPRVEIVAHLRAWLAEHESPAVANTVGDVISDSLLWGHSGLIRRPKDTRWEKRTDIFHRQTRRLLPELPLPDFAPALRDLVRVHLGAYGPALREDLAFFCAVPVGAVNRAVADLGDEVVRLPGPEREDYLDLAEPPAAGPVDPGVRLLPEFDGLLMGYARPNRFRFLTEDQLPQVWSKVNAVVSPVVLHDGRIVASWKTVGSGRAVAIEVRMLDPHPPLTDDSFVDAVLAVETVLDLTVTTLRVFPAPA